MPTAAQQQQMAAKQAAVIAAKKAASTAAAQRVAARSARQSSAAAAQAQKIANQKLIQHTNYVNRHPNQVTITNGILVNPKTGLTAPITDANAVFNATYGGGGDTSLNTPTTASVGVQPSDTGTTGGTSDTGGILGLNGEQTAANVVDTAASVPWYQNHTYWLVGGLGIVAVVVFLKYHKKH